MNATQPVLLAEASHVERSRGMKRSLVFLARAEHKC